MSYSFVVQAESKEGAKAAVLQKMAEVCEVQVCHLRDQQQAVQAAGMFIDALTDDDTKDVVVACNGYLSGTWEGTDVTDIKTASFAVTASLTLRKPQA